MDWNFGRLNLNDFSGNFINATDGEAIFVYDYFSKAQQGLRSDPFVYNDYIGNVNSEGHAIPLKCMNLFILTEFL